MSPKQLTRTLEQVMGDTTEELARTYCSDLRQYLWDNHRITGLLSESIDYEMISETEAVAGSSVPYAGFFERKTGAVETFAEMWLTKARKEAVKAAVRAAKRRIGGRRR